MQRDRRTILHDAVRGRLDVTGVRMPKLRFLAADAEASLEILGIVREIGHIVDVRVAGSPVNPGHLGIQPTAEFAVLLDL